MRLIMSQTVILTNQTSDTDTTQQCTSPSATLSISSSSSHSSFDLNRNSYCQVARNGRTSLMDIDNNDDDDDENGGDMNNFEEKEEKKEDDDRLQAQTEEEH